MQRLYQNVSNIEGANARLSSLLNAALRRLLGDATLIRVVCNQLNCEAPTFDIQVVDVRIRRADLPEQNSKAAYSRMQTRAAASGRVDS